MQERILRKYLAAGALAALLSGKPLRLGSQDCDPGCDPNEEQQCIDDGGVWDSETCTCDDDDPPPGCDPAEAAACVNSGGTWNDIDCTCESCSPTPELLDAVSWSEQTCEWDGGVYREMTCEYTEEYYQDYCQNGSPYGDPYSVAWGSCSWGNECYC